MRRFLKVCSVVISMGVCAIVPGCAVDNGDQEPVQPPSGGKGDSPSGPWSYPPDVSMLSRDHGLLVTQFNVGVFKLEGTVDADGYVDALPLSVRANGHSISVPMKRGMSACQVALAVQHMVTTPLFVLTRCASQTIVMVEIRGPQQSSPPVRLAASSDDTSNHSQGRPFIGQLNDNQMRVGLPHGSSSDPATTHVVLLLDQVSFEIDVPRLLPAVDQITAAIPSTYAVAVRRDYSRDLLCVDCVGNDQFLLTIDRAP